MRALAATAAALLLASCFDPGGQCQGDAECPSDQVCGPDALCVPGARPPVGDAPQAIADSYPFVGRGPFDVLTANGLLKNDSDPGGATLTAELVERATYGQVYLAPDGSFTYAPIANFSGQDGFTYRATNGTRSSSETRVTVTVLGPPIAVLDPYGMSTASGATLTVVAPGVLANDSDPRNKPPASAWTGLTAQLVAGSGPANGTVVLNADGSFTYTPNGGFTGSDAFTYVATNGTQTSDPAPVRLTVGP